MSLTEVYTDTKEGRGRPRTASNVSISLHARPLRPMRDAVDAPKNIDKDGDIELAQLEVQGDAIHPSGANTDKASPTPLPSPPKASKWKTHVQFATLCFTLFLAGWNDGTTGPLLPRIQSNYHV